MKKRLLFICLFLPIIWSKNTLAQQDPQFTQYMFNRFFLNPAYAGLEMQSQFNFVHRTQWAAYNPTFDNGGSPSTQVLSFHTSFPRLNSGLGFFVMNDAIGPQSNLALQLSYAYHVILSNNRKLSFGAKAGFYSITIDFDQLRFRQDNDPFDNIAGKESQMKPDIGFGVYYDAGNFFVSLTANHLLEQRFNFGTEEVDNSLNPLARSFFGMLGYNYEINDIWVITPTILVKSDLNAISVEGGAVLTYDKRFWMGASYRHEESGNVLIGLNVPSKNKQIFSIGYSFDYVYGGQAAKQPTSHEVTLAYILPVKAPVYPAIIRTPRFRY